MEKKTFNLKCNDDVFPFTTSSKLSIKLALIRGRGVLYESDVYKRGDLLEGKLFFKTILGFAITGDVLRIESVNRNNKKEYCYLMLVIDNSDFNCH